MGDACGRVLEWELGLPAAGELTPLSHPLISRTLAAAFKINLPGFPPASPDARLSSDSPTSHLSFPHDDDDEEEAEEEEEGTEDSTGGGGGDGREGGGAGRGGKKPRMVWTAELHHRFVEAVAHLGEKDAVPKAIVQLMNVEGLTRENVASHLQKYRLYLKRTRAAAAPSPPSVARFGGSPPSPGQRLQPPPIAPVSWPHAHRDGEKLGCW